MLALSKKMNASVGFMLGDDGSTVISAVPIRQRKNKMQAAQICQVTFMSWKFLMTKKLFKGRFTVWGSFRLKKKRDGASMLKKVVQKG